MIPLDNNIEWWACSDIHGCLWHLEEAIRILGLNEHRRLLVLGDIVDRGRESSECLTLIRENPYIQACMGNHDLYWVSNDLRELTTPENFKYLCELPLGFKLDLWEPIYLTHAFQPDSVLQGIDKVDLTKEGSIYEDDHTFLKSWEFPYTLITGHIPARIHPKFKSTKRYVGEVLRYGKRIFLDGSTPTLGILPLYNIREDYEISIIKPKEFTGLKPRRNKL